MTMIQVRHVPDEMHRRLKARAALAGMSLSDYVLAELRRSLERPTREELFEALRALPERPFTPTPTQIIREERDARAGG